ncbi:MAG: hypothetical protein IPI22_06710 [Bacteroidetes bacterium]|nr:hypothetical protein [Bacteroidota bacterium]HQW46784.1 hypothetical protein [Chitinophagaceae bacterium]
MSNIKYVIFSDLHLGAENSILTNLVSNSVETDDTQASEVLIKMVACLRDVVSKNTDTQKPVLVLNGDIVELALTSTNKASMAFERFIELVMPADGEALFDKNVLYLSGNHDHNLWERSRNHYYIQYLETLKAGDYIEDEIHCTKLFNSEIIPATFLGALFHRYAHLQDVNVTTVYPSHALLSEDKQKCVIISHGHYVESIYSLMTSLRSKIFPDRVNPLVMEELENENYAWVDFFWSTLGRSGSVGKDINLIYDKLQDPAQVKILIKNIAESFTENIKNKVMGWVEEKLLQELLTLTLGRMASNERNEPEVVLTPDATKGLKQFIELYIANQIKQELNGYLPPNVSFVFGHTHKPYQQMYTYEGYANPVKVYNSGGWVVDTMKMQPLHGGSVILIDEHLDVLALQMYREGKLTVTVEDLKDTFEKNCPFYEHISSVINMQAEPWVSFSATVAKEIEQRYQNLAQIAQSGN